MSLVTSRRRTLLVAAAFVLLVPSLLDAGLFRGHRTVPCPPPPEWVPAVPPQQAIRAVLDGQVVAWNRGDLDGFMRGYWNSPELSFFSGGTRTRGWQATMDRYQK